MSESFFPNNTLLRNPLFILSPHTLEGNMNSSALFQIVLEKVKGRIVLVLIIFLD